MVRELGAEDLGAALELLRARPLQNVFLEHVVRSGLLGKVPGIFGWYGGEGLGAILMVGPQGGTALEVRDDRAQPELAERAAAGRPRPRHIVGAESVTRPFWEHYKPHADPLIWTRREPVYRLGQAALAGALGNHAEDPIEPAGERELDEIVANSARQHVEDLGDDRFAADPDAFRRRHWSDIRERRWWVLREGGRIAFQVHVGPENDHTVQIGGVLTPPELRGRGIATRGVAAISALLLERLPTVSLFCAEHNAPARRVYEKLGFEVALQYRSYLLA